MNPRFFAHKRRLLVDGRLKRRKNIRWMVLSLPFVIRSLAVSHHETRIILIIPRPVLPEIVRNKNFKPVNFVCSSKCFAYTATPALKALYSFFHTSL